MATNSKTKSNSDFSISDADRVTVVTHPRELHMFRVTEDEIDNLETAGNYKALDVAMFALSFGIFMSFLVEYLIDPSKPEGLTSYLFTSFMMICFLSSIFFGVRSIISWRRNRTLSRRLKGQS